MSLKFSDLRNCCGTVKIVLERNYTLTGNGCYVCKLSAEKEGKCLKYPVQLILLEQLHVQTREVVLY